MLGIASKGFDLLRTVRTIISHWQQLASLHKETLQKVQQGSMGRIVHVMVHDKVANLCRQRMGEAAKQWLDKLETSYRRGRTFSFLNGFFLFC